MPRSKFLATGIALTTILVCLVAVVQWRVTAQDNILPLGEVVNGVIEIGETDRWTFEAHRSDVMEFTIAPDGSDLIPQLSVVNRSGALQARIQANDTLTPTTLTFRLPEFGQYTVEVTGLAETGGSYELTMTLIEAGLRDFEQGRLTFGQPVSQRISDDVPYHIWSFLGRAGQVIDLNMTTTDGDLQPVISLVSPGDDLVALADANDEGDKARVLAARLPGDGIYRIFARRAGSNLGFNGDSRGTYQLEATLRNGLDATANSLAINTTVPGRLTADSPLARYNIPTVGVVVVNVELTEADCLVDVAIMNQGITLLDRFTGISPLTVPVDIPDVQQPIIEVASQNCPGADSIDFNLTVSDLDIALPLRQLAAGQPSVNRGESETERWFFAASAGDIVNLRIDKDRANRSAAMRVIAPTNATVYTRSFFTSLQEALLLEQSGIYVIEISANDSPYTLRQNILGRDGQPFSEQSPAWEESLDIATPPQVWRFTVNTERPAILLVENPQGEIIYSAASTDLGGPRVPTATLAQPGRYRIKVLSDQPPDTVAFLQIYGGQLDTNGTVKAALNAPLPSNRWELPVRAGDSLNLTLEMLSTNGDLPDISVLNQAGLIVQPTLTQSDASNRSISLLGINAEADERYTVLVSSDPASSPVEYRLSLENITIPAQPTLVLNTSTPTPVGFEDNLVEAVTTPLAPRFPLENTTLFENAAPLRIPDARQAEILPNKIRDLWAVNIARGQLFTVSVTSVDGQPAPGITLIDPERKIVLERWERDQANNRIVFRTTVAGEYYLAITSSPVGSRYLLEADTQPGLDESVPIIQDLRALTFGERAFASFERPSETATYAFWGTGGNEILINASYDSGSLAPQFEVRAPSGATIAEASFDEASGSAQSEAITLPQTGLYQVIVAAAQITRENVFFSRYSLLMLRSSGRGLSGGHLQDEIIGTLTLEQRQQTWIVEGAAGDDITLDVEPLGQNGPTPLAVTVADTEGTPFYVDNTRLSVSSIRAQNLILPQTGLYRVIVSGGGEATGSYRITLTRNNNHNRPQARAMTYGDTLGGIFTPENSVERLMLAGNRGDVMALALRPLRGTLAPIGFQIETANGDVLRAGADGLTGIGAREEGIELPATGLYYVTIGVTDPNFSGSLVFEVSAERQNQAGARSSGAVIDYDRTHSGILFADDPSDLWIFQGEADDSITVTVAGDGNLQPGFTLTAYDAPIEDGQPQPLLTRTGTADQPAQLIEYVLPRSGAYAIRVTGTDGTTGFYTINATLNGNITRTPVRLTSGNAQDSLIENSVADTWQFEGATGDRVAFTVTVSRRDDLIPELTLTGPAGNTLLRSTDFDGEFLETRPLRLPIDGTYLVTVAPAQDSRQNARDSYSIELTSQASNETTDTLRPLAYGESGINALARENLSDRWVFEGQAGDVIHIVGAQTSDDLDPVLTLRGPSGTVITTADDSPGSLNAEITTVLAESGRHVIDIAAFGGQLSSTAGNYRLDLTLNYRPAATAVPNARVITYGEHIIDTLEPTQPSSPQTETWFFFGQQGDSIQSTLQYPGESGPLLMFVADGARNRLIQGERQQDRVVVADYTLPTDSFYILEIQRPADGASESFIPYTLRLDLNSSRVTVPINGGFLQRGVTYSAAFSAKAAAHTWLYSGSVGEHLSLNMLRSAGESGPTVLVYAPDNRVLVNHTPARGEETTSLPITLPADGFYQVVVINSLDDPFLSYRLAVNGGNEPSVAGRLLYGIPESGSLSGSIPQQVWLIDGEAGSAFHARGRTTSGNLNLGLRLEDANGLVLAVGQFDASSQQVVLPGAILPTDGEYFLITTRAGGTFDDSSGAYTIRASAFPSAPQALSATPLVSGEAASGFDNGVFSFFGEQNQVVALGAESLEGGPMPDLRATSESGEHIITTEGAIEALPLPSAGVYLVEVLTTPPQPYTLHFVARGTTSTSGAEQRPLPRFVNVPGSLSSARPEELWAVEAEIGESLIFSGTDFNRVRRLDFTLFDPRGVPIATAIEPLESTELNFGPIFIAETGVYTLRVGNWLNQVSASDSQYVLRAATVDEIGSDGGQIFAFGQEVRGGLDADDSEDVWTFAGSAGMEIDIALQNRVGRDQLQMELRAPDGQVVDTESYVTRDGLITSLERLPILETGSYLLKVSADEPEEITAYSLRVSRFDLPLAAILEGAQTAPIGEAVSGTLGESVSAQAWVFYANAGQGIAINASSDDNARPILLRLIGPDAQPIRAGDDGDLPPSLLLEDGFYSVIVSANGDTTLNYELEIRREQPRTTWRWVLAPGEAARGTLNADAMLHEYRLSDLQEGDYQVVVQPTSPHWQARAFLLDASEAVLAIGEVQSDGSTRLTVRLDDSQDYRLHIAAGGAGGTYDVLFDVSNNAATPAPLTAGTSMIGRLNALDTADEWLWQTDTEDIISIRAARIDGDFDLSVRLYAPGNLFLQQFDANGNGEILAESVLLPVEGTYIIQVTRNDELLSPAAGVYEIEVNRAGE